MVETHDIEQSKETSETRPRPPLMLAMDVLLRPLTGPLRRRITPT